LFFQVPQAVFPLIEDFTGVAPGWTTFGLLNNDFFGLILASYRWALTTATNPNGLANDRVIFANFYNSNTGLSYLRTPLLDFSGLTQPVMAFQMAHASYAGEADAMRVLASLDGGLTYQPVPLYDRTHLSTPSLSMAPANLNAYIPAAADEWRHMLLDLSAYAGQPSVLFSFEATTANGNNLYLDNILITEAQAFVELPVNAVGPQTLGSLTVDFNGIGAAGGSLALARLNNPPPFVGPLPVQEFANPPAATTAAGISPDIELIYPEGWYIAGYSGLDYLHPVVNYDLSIDLTGYLSVGDPTQVYLCKREDHWGSWEAATTTLAGNVVSSTGFTRFSDLGAGGPVVPLEAEALDLRALAQPEGNLLRWEGGARYDHFVVERAAPGEAFVPLAQVPGAGEERHYLDRQAPAGRSTYRLKQMLPQGSWHYSSQVTVLQAPEPVQVYPTQVKQLLYLRTQEGGPLRFQLFDLGGRLVWEESRLLSGPSSLNLSLQALPAGRYTYRLTLGQQRQAGLVEKL
jgi:hypothetical protein